MAGIFDVDLGGLVKGVGDVADNLFTSDEERLTIALDEKKVDAGERSGQVGVNLESAKHKSVFVAGARPAIIWVGAFAMAYQFIVYPLMGWYWTMLQAMGLMDAGIPAPPPLVTGELYPVIMGVLGIGGMRSFDKVKGNVTDSILPPKPVAEKKAWQFWK